MRVKIVLPLTLIIAILTLLPVQLQVSAETLVTGKTTYLGENPVLVDYQPVGDEYLMVYKTDNSVVFIYTNGTYKSFSTTTGNPTSFAVTYNGKPYIILGDENPSGGTSIYITTMKSGGVVYNYTLPTTSYISPLAVQLSGDILQLIFTSGTLMVNLTDMNGYFYNMSVTYTGSDYWVADGPNIYRFDKNWNYIGTQQIHYTGPRDATIRNQYVLKASGKMYVEFNYIINNYIPIYGYMLASIIGNKLYEVPISDTGGFPLPYKAKSDGTNLIVSYIDSHGKTQVDTRVIMGYFTAQTSIPQNLRDLVVLHYGVTHAIPFNGQYLLVIGNDLISIPQGHRGPLLSSNYTIIQYPTQTSGMSEISYSISPVTGSYRRPTVQTIIPTLTSIPETEGVATFSNIPILDISDDVRTRITVILNNGNVLVYPNNNFVYAIYNASDTKLVSVSEEVTKPCIANLSTGNRGVDGPNYKNYGYGFVFYKQGDSYYPVFIDIIRVFTTNYGDVVGFNVENITSIVSDNRTINITLDGYKNFPVPSIISVELPEDATISEIMVDGVPTNDYIAKDNWVSVDPDYTVTILLSPSTGRAGSAILGGSTNNLLYHSIRSLITILAILLIPVISMKRVQTN